jgi:hypothetical protein
VTWLGATLSARRVRATLTFATDEGEHHRAPLDLALVAPSVTAHNLRSVLGRDVIDLFRLTVDRSVGVVSRTDAAGDLTASRWPNGEPRR